MKTPLLPIGLFLVAAAVAAETPPPAVEGVKGVRQEGAAKVKTIDPRTPRPVSPGKAEGVEQSANAVKPAPAPGTVAAPTPPPPPQGVGQEATAVKPAPGNGTASTPPPPPPPQGVDQAATAVKPAAAPGTVAAPMPPPPPQGVGQEATAVKPAGGPGTASTPPPPPPPQGVDQGATSVKPAGGPGTASAPPPPPPPQGVGQAAPAAEPVAGQGTPAPVAPAQPKGVGSVEGVKTPGAGAIRAVEGVAGIDTDKLRNLEAALQAKPTGPGDGPKAKAAAQLLGKPATSNKPPEEKTDGRSDFQDRIPDKGS